MSVCTHDNKSRDLFRIFLFSSKLIITVTQYQYDTRSNKMKNSVWGFTALKL